MDYYKIGQRVRALRRGRDLSQEALAERVGISVTHMSHIETGNSIPSLQTLVDTMNALGCSADELFCMEVEKSRPALDNWLCQLVADCDSTEAKLIADTVTALKASLRRLKVSDDVNDRR